MLIYIRVRNEKNTVKKQTHQQRPHEGSVVQGLKTIIREENSKMDEKGKEKQIISIDLAADMKNLMQIK